MLSSNISPTCPHNMVNFGPLAAEVRWRVWDIPATFNGFRVLAALVHGIVVVGVVYDRNAGCITIVRVGWLGFNGTFILTQNRSYRACRFVGIFYSKL